MALPKLVTDNAIKIEKGIPCPAARFSRSAYPLDKMEVGDSFAVPASKYGSLRQTVSARAAKLGREFRVSKNGEEVRCWRVA